MRTLPHFKILKCKLWYPLFNPKKFATHPLIPKVWTNRPPPLLQGGMSWVLTGMGWVGVLGMCPSYSAVWPLSTGCPRCIVRASPSNTDWIGKNPASLIGQENTQQHWLIITSPSNTDWSRQQPINPQYFAASTVQTLPACGANIFKEENSRNSRELSRK